MRVMTELFADGKLMKGTVATRPDLITGYAATIGGVPTVAVTNTANGGYLTQTVGRTIASVSEAFVKADLNYVSTYYPNNSASMGLYIKGDNGGAVYWGWGGSSPVGGIGTRADFLHTTSYKLADGASWPTLNSGYHRVELRVDAASGIVQTKLDGTLDINFSGVINNLTNITEVGIYWYLYSNRRQYFANVMANDNTGSSDNTWVGPRYLTYLIPNANGTHSQWLGSDGNSVDNYLHIDDFDSNTVESDNVGDKDTYNLGDFTLPAGHSIKRVTTVADVMQLAGAGRAYKLGIRTNGSEFWSGNIATEGIDYTRGGADWQTNPATGAAWTESDLDNLEIGIQTA